MCLHALKKFKVKLDENGEGIGWKLFEKERHWKCYRGYFWARWYKPNTWYKASNAVIPNYFDVPYPAGFHICQTKKAVQLRKTKGPYTSDNCKIAKVKFRNIVATGTEKDKHVIVAKEMMIIE